MKNKKQIKKKTTKKKTTAIIKVQTKVPSPFSQSQLLFVLQRTPKNHIYKRKGKGGGEFSFVTGVYIKKVLNYLTGWMWDFNIVDKGREENQVWVQGRLTIKNKKGEPIITKEQFGRADVKYYKDKAKGMLDYGNDLKAAATDALKKCASELGIASDVYAGNEFKDIQNEDKGFIPPEDEIAVEGEVVTEKEPEINAKVEELKSMLKGNDDMQKRADLLSRTGISLGAKLDTITTKHAVVLIVALLSKEVKQ